MRVLLALSILVSVASAHGGSGRSAPSGGGMGGPVPVSVPGGTTTPSGRRGGAPETIASFGWEHRWTMWWAYNREYHFAARLRGSRTGRSNYEAARKELREKIVIPIMLEALEDKSHDVRGAAAIALGKFGDEKFDAALTRRADPEIENWFDVREAALYALGLLRLPVNRNLMTSIAGNKERLLGERSMALTSLALDRDDRSQATLEWHLKYYRSRGRSKSSQLPSKSEEDRRRYAAHMLGFVDKKFDVNALLWKAARGSRRWGDAVQGLAVCSLGRRRARDYKDRLFQLAYASETPRPVMQSVPIALGVILHRGDKADIERLAAFATDFRGYPAVRHFTAMALARIGGPHARKALLRYVKNNTFNGTEDRGFLYLALGIIGRGDQEICDTLMAHYQRNQPLTTRSALAIALGLARHKPAVELTMRYLGETNVAESEPVSNGGSGASKKKKKKDRNKAQRQSRGAPLQPKWHGADFLAYATLSLGLHGDPRGISVAQRVLRKFHHPKVQSHAAIALVLLKRGKAFEDLEPILRKSGSVSLRAAAVMALGLVPEPSQEVVDLLHRQYALDSTPTPVRAMAIVGLGAIADSNRVPWSVSLVWNYNYLIRCHALDLIATLL